MNPNHNWRMEVLTFEGYMTVLYFFISCSLQSTDAMHIVVWHKHIILIARCTQKIVNIES